MTAGIDTVCDAGDLRRLVEDWRADGLRVGFVPTMGALHAGHLSLVDLARQSCDRVIVSIFVNPRQFGPGEDLDTYPRDEARDREKLAAAGADLLYMPRLSDIYPAGFSTRVEVQGLSEVLCGCSRPHFFAGVATVVLKLFLQTRPDVAVFGEKDYQQLLVIRALVGDLELPIEIVAGPTVRESDGVAMSSRNDYLTSAERAVAPELFRTISVVADGIAAGHDIGEAVAAGIARLRSAGFDIDYLEVRNAESLAPLAALEGRPARVFAAATLGRTRLIDNVAVTRPAPPAYGP